MHVYARTMQIRLILCSTNCRFCKLSLYRVFCFFKLELRFLTWLWEEQSKRCYSLDSLNYSVPEIFYFVTHLRGDVQLVWLYRIPHQYKGDVMSEKSRCAITATTPPCTAQIL